ncbi:TonB family protein [Glaciimonas sp. CA11.2]|uniref:TonB family protein n=1 Tax=unclassified Glaciimonas TaxID=2644401 RepID=UPI002AB5B20E|nr:MULTISPECIES: TonB family protein [unclassified Glaciimonas]MDY7544792.1 TonB family protein [Glaciimonas sp. CA11.2]MEB0011910.1 TonB family protein [Glaciimonas sp. Cout2]MEB0082855.1 TonB family protein [Glaciimonas sp. Gout2]MEB0163670.1 TonB family protein [Glaciimonas sp. CA11.2]
MSATIPIHRFPVGAFGLAVLVEIALVTVVGIILVATPSKPALSAPVPITLLSEEKPPEALPTPKPPEPARPKPQPTPKTKVIPTKPQAQTVPQKPVTPPTIPLPLAQTPTAFAEPTSMPAPPSPPTPPPATSGKADASLAYAAKVRAAVQAAVAYPPAAAALHFSGRVRVEFHLRDAIPSQASVIISSAIGMIDRAALQSVQNAHYPEPPTDMRGVDKLYQVWVEFTR